MSIKQQITLARYFAFTRPIAEHAYRPLCSCASMSVEKCLWVASGTWAGAGSVSFTPP